MFKMLMLMTKSPRMEGSRKLSRIEPGSCLDGRPPPCTTGVIGGCEGYVVSMGKCSKTHCCTVLCSNVYAPNFHWPAWWSMVKQPWRAAWPGEALVRHQYHTSRDTEKKGPMLSFCKHPSSRPALSSKMSKHWTRVVNADCEAVYLRYHWAEQQGSCYCGGGRFAECMMFFMVV